MSFANASAIVDMGDGQYAFDIAAGWDVMGITNGGYLMATAARAATQATGRPDPLTMTTHFMAPSRPGPATVQVSVLKEGRQTSTATFSLINGDRTTMAGIVTCADLSQMEGLELMRIEPPDLPAQEDCVLVRPTDTFPPPMMGQFELRLHPEDAAALTGNPSGVPMLRGWVRLHEGEALTTPAVVLFSDVFPPTIFNSGLPMAWTPTVELTVQLRNRPTGDWLACVFESNAMTAGAIETDGYLWDEAGTLVAHSRQLQLVRT